MSQEPIQLNYRAATQRRKRFGSGTIVSGVVGAVGGFILFALLVVVTDRMSANTYYPNGYGFLSNRPPTLRVMVAPYAYAAGMALGREHSIVELLKVLQGFAYGTIIAVAIDRRFAMKALLVLALAHFTAFLTLMILYR